jgi:hypothetical protein
VKIPQQLRDFTVASWGLGAASILLQSIGGGFRAIFRTASDLRAEPLILPFESDFNQEIIVSVQSQAVSRRDGCLGDGKTEPREIA